MSKGSAVIALGVLIMLVAISGIPSTFKIGALIVLGFLIAGIGFLVRQEKQWLMQALKDGQISGMDEAHEATHKILSE